MSVYLSVCLYPVSLCVSLLEWNFYMRGVCLMVERFYCIKVCLAISINKYCTTRTCVGSIFLCLATEVFQCLVIHANALFSWISLLE